MKSLFAVSICLLALALGAMPPQQQQVGEKAPPPALQGFLANSAQAERDWEAKFRTIPSPENLREYMRLMSARPHHVGSPYDRQNAEWMLSKFKEWGWDAHIENFDVLFPTPKERHVELLGPAQEPDGA